MKNLKCRIIPIVLIVAMICLVLSACGGSTPQASNTGMQESTSQAPASETTASQANTMEPITMTLLIGQQDIPSGGIQNSSVFNEIAKQTGITLDVVTVDPDKFKVLTAGGDLPDIIELEDAGNSTETLINSSAVIPLDDLLDKYGQNIKKNIPVALKYSKVVLGHGKTYFLPVHTSTEDKNNPTQNGFVGFLTRYDVYKAIGSPEMKNPDDYLNVLKQMQDFQPKTEDGKKVYALSAWTDWGLWPYMISYPFMFGYYNLSNDQLLNRQTGKGESMFLAEDGIFWQGLKFFNKAYRMGIFDPEAFTMKSNQYETKIQNGEVLVAAGNWWQPDKKLGETALNVYLPGAFPILPGVYQEDSLLGYNAALARAISSNCKYPERAMQLLNFFDSTEGARLLTDGVKGVDWDYVDGKPQLIGEMLKAMQDNTYDQYRKDHGIFRLHQKYTSGNFKTEDGYPIDLSATSDFYKLNANPAMKAFAMDYDASFTYPGQVYDKWIKEGKANSLTTYPLAGVLAAPTSDVTTQAETKADQYFQANIARIVMAKDDAAFDAAKKKAIDDVKAMGLENAQKEIDDNFSKAQDLVKTITPGN